MRIKEIITEGGVKPIDPEHRAALQNASTFPSMNMSTGSAYMNYRFGLALAGAPDYPTKAENWIGGDPLLSTYTDVEMEMINAAAAQVGAGHAKKWSSKRSEEVPGVNKLSTTAKIKKNKYGV